jgi:translation initiation factor IF-1
MRRHSVRLLPGDAVTIELSRCDPSKGRIVDHGRGPANDGAGVPV